MILSVQRAAVIFTKCMLLVEIISGVGLVLLPNTHKQVRSVNSFKKQGSAFSTTSPFYF